MGGWARSPLARQATALAASCLALGLLAGACAHTKPPATPCTNDDDCTGDTWCRPTEAGGNECVPFVQEGERCEGFVLPWTRERCAPGLVCTDWPEPTHDVPGFCRPAGASCEERPPEVSFTTIERGQSSVTNGSANLEVIRDQSRLNQVWQELALSSTPPAINFSLEMVVYYTMGTQPDGCYSTEIESVHVGGGRILAGILELEPGANCVCTFSLVQPYHLVRTAAQPGTEEPCIRREKLVCPG